MENWKKYLISTIAFFVMYTLVRYLFTKNLNWKLTIVATIIYGILYTGIDLVCKKLKNK